MPADGSVPIAVAIPICARAEPVGDRVVLVWPFGRV